jgi:hypothetical protein
MHPALQYDLMQARQHDLLHQQPSSAWPRTPAQRAWRAVTTRQLHNGGAYCAWYGARSPHEQPYRQRRRACQPECAFLRPWTGSQS